jgi:two-component system CheB/CheR fusion protein
MSKSKTAPADSPKPQFPVVGIGASAGGLEAIKLFLQALPKKTGMVFVFVQHLSPTHVSILPDILDKISPIPVIAITDGISLKQDHFYICPENTLVKMVDGVH